MPTRPVPEYKKQEPNSNNIYPEPLPTAEELRKKLNTTGKVEITIPNLGGMKPTEDPAIIHEEDIPILGIPQKSVNTILYGQQLGWNQFKVARDIKEKIESELTELLKLIAEYKEILADINKVLAIIKEEMLEINKKEFEALNRQNKLLRQVILYMAGGMKELVANGTSETVCNLLQEPDKEVKENASEEIQ